MNDDIPTTPNPHNYRQRVAKLSDKVDPQNPQRDGEVFPDDPRLTRMGNCVRYMRRNEMYLPPNPWPEGMMLYGIDEDGSLCCMFLMLLRQFETISYKDLFGLCNPKTRRLYFIPFPKMPPSNEAAQLLIQQYLARTSREEFARQTLYLEVNNWWVDKHDTGETGDPDSGETGGGRLHRRPDADESSPSGCADPGGGSSN